MRALAQRAARLYGERLFHLLVVLAALALGAYAISVLGVQNLFNPTVWWQSIVVWFVVAVIGHDLILFPLYALADRLLPRRRTGPNVGDEAPRNEPKHIPVTNYLRMPTLAAGLLLLTFLPGIIEQGAPTYQAATGQTQAPYLARWLLLTAAFYLASALCYAVRTLLRQRDSTKTAKASPPAASINAGGGQLQRPPARAADQHRLGRRIRGALRRTERDQTHDVDHREQPAWQRG